MKRKLPKKLVLDHKVVVVLDTSPSELVVGGKGGGGGGVINGIQKSLRNCAI